MRGVSRPSDNNAMLYFFIRRPHSTQVQSLELIVKSF